MSTPYADPLWPSHLRRPRVVERRAIRNGAQVVDNNDLSEAAALSLHLVCSVYFVVCSM